MASPYSPFGPSTGPGTIQPPVVFANLPAPLPGYGFNSGITPVTITPIAPTGDINGILLENSPADFVELEGASGVLLQE